MLNEPLGDLNRKLRKLTEEQFLEAFTTPFLIHEHAQSQVEYESTQTMGLHTIPTSIDPREARAWIVYQLKGEPRLPDTVTVGRDESNSLVLNDPSVSKRHAKFEISGDTTTLTDLGSRNGTFVGQERLEASTPAVITSGQTVTLGRIPLRYLTSAEFFRYCSDLREEGKL